MGEYADLELDNADAEELRKITEEDEMKKRICDNCTQQETCYLYFTIVKDKMASLFFSAGNSVRTSDLALACKFYEEDND